MESESVADTENSSSAVKARRQSRGSIMDSTQVKVLSCGTDRIEKMAEVSENSTKIAAAALELRARRLRVSLFSVEGTPPELHDERFKFEQDREIASMRAMKSSK